MRACAAMRTLLNLMLGGRRYDDMWMSRGGGVGLVRSRAQVMYEYESQVRREEVYFI